MFEGSVVNLERRELVELVVPSVEIARRYPTELSVSRSSLHVGRSIRMSASVAFPASRQWEEHVRDSEPSVVEKTAPGWAVSNVERFRDHRGKWRTSRRCWPTSATWWLWRRARAHRLLVRAKRSSCPILGISRDSCRSTVAFCPYDHRLVVSIVAMGTTNSWAVLQVLRVYTVESRLSKRGDRTV